MPTRPKFEIVIIEGRKRSAAIAGKYLHDDDDRRLDVLGREVLDDDRPVDEAIVRPPTLQQQIARLNRAGEMVRSYYQGLDDLEDDDFAEYLDEQPEEGLTPYEVEAAKEENPVKRAVKGVFKRQKEEKAPKAANSSSPPSGASQTVEEGGEGEA